MLDIHYDALKDVLKDLELEVGGEKKKAIDVIADWEDGLVKTRSTNANYKEEQKQWKQERENLQKQLTELNTLKADLEKKIVDSSMSDEEKKRLEKMRAGGYILKDEMERQLNAFQEQIKELEKKNNEFEQKSKEAEERQRNASRSSVEEKMRADIISEFGKNKIIGAQADAAYYTLVSKGNVKIEDSEKGFVPVFVNFNESNKEMAATLESVCKKFADTNPWAVSSSGKQGSGQNHETNKGGGTSGTNYMNMLRMEK